MDIVSSSINGEFLNFLISTTLKTNIKLRDDKESRFIKRGYNSLHKNGDVIVLKPLQHIASNSEDVENASELIELSNILVSSTKVFKENLQIFLNRKLILSTMMPLFIDCSYETKNLSKYKIQVYIPDHSENESVTTHRCCLVGLHLKNIFKLNGAVVQSYFDEEKIERRVESDHLLYKVCDSFDSSVKKHPQKLILCSPVLDRKKGAKLSMSQGEFKSSLSEELKRAILHKVGHMTEEALESYLENLVIGCLNLQFLNVSHSSVLKLNVDEPNNTRESAFVLYNHARLCNLLKNFESLLCEGVIPDLPLTSTVDFTLLKHSEEWDLFWLFIHKYPELLREICDECLCNSESKEGTLISLPVHKISKFLHKLSHCLSVYYSRVHVLPSNQDSKSKSISHLLPTLWARIYLLKSVLNIMKSCLQLLNISPPDIM